MDHWVKTQFEPEIDGTWWGPYSGESSANSLAEKVTSINPENSCSAPFAAVVRGTRGEIGTRLIEWYHGRRCDPGFGGWDDFPITEEPIPLQTNGPHPLQ